MCADASSNQQSSKERDEETKSLLEAGKETLAALHRICSPVGLPDLLFLYSDVRNYHRIQGLYGNTGNFRKPLGRNEILQSVFQFLPLSGLQDEGVLSTPEPQGSRIQKPE